MTSDEQPLSAYEREPYRTELEVRVLQRQVDEEGRAYALLDDTILYPAGGGQPADHGRLGDTPIVDVQRVGDEIRHFHDADLDAAATHLALDWERRYDHMQQHTAQHLLTAVAAAEHGWETTSFHLGAEHADIELDTASITDEELALVEERVVEHIRDDLPVATRRIDAGRMAAVGVRSRGLPDGHRGDVRIVSIGDIDRTACGGTHVARTGELETVVLLGSEPMRGGTRLFWLAGRRVRRHLHAQGRLVTATRRLFETSEAELLEVARSKLDRLADAERRIGALRGRLAVETARRLQIGAGDLVDEHFEEADAVFLRAVAAELRRGAPSSLAFLTGTSTSGTLFLLSAGEALDLDLRRLGASVAESLEGRGGGGPDLVQGKVGSLDRRAVAVALARAALAGTTR